MKIIWRMFCCFLLVITIAAGLILPDLLLSFLDEQNSRITTETLPAVTLELTEKLSLHEKAYLVSSHEKFTQPTTKNKATQYEAEKAADDFFDALRSNLLIDPEETLDFTETNALLYMSQSSETTAVVWEIVANFNDYMMLEFTIDDDSLEVLAFGLYFNEFNGVTISGEMWLVVDALQTKFLEIFGDGKWYAEQEEFLYDEEFDNVTEEYTSAYSYAVYILETVADGRHYHFRMDVFANEVHFGEW